tara:strand:- start:563 stop:910 length:348 start_codon:yes stop_codon:yes gene_type:complete
MSTIFELAKDLNGKIQQFIVVGSKWAKEDSLKRYLESMTKVVKSEVKVREQQKGVGVTASEDIALASQEYKDHLKKLSEVTQQANEHEIEKESIRMSVMTQQSLNKLSIAERKMY